MASTGNLVSPVLSIGTVTGVKIYDGASGTPLLGAPSSLISFLLPQIPSPTGFDIFYIGILGNWGYTSYTSTNCNLNNFFYYNPTGSTASPGIQQNSPGYPNNFWFCSNCGPKFTIPSTISSSITTEASGISFWNTVFLNANASNIAISGGSCSGTGSASISFPTIFSGVNYNINSSMADYSSVCPMRLNGNDTNSVDNVTPGGGFISGCFNPYSCSSVPTGYGPYIYSQCGIQSGQVINPYQIAMKGIWRPKYTYTYNSFRAQNDNIRTDGVFDDFQRFPWENPSTRNVKWVRANTITKNLPHDYEVENVDPIGIFSSAVYGYNFTMPVGVAKNARYNEIAFDGFEDYPLVCEDDHFKFGSYSANITTAFAHTGNYSMSVPVSSGVSLTRLVKTTTDYSGYDAYTVDNNPLIDDYSYPNPSLPQQGGHYVAHILNDNDFVGKFAPIAGKKYVLSVWVRMATTPSYLYTDPGISLNFTTTGGTTTLMGPFLPSGNIIDGWQRIYAEFVIPANANSITVQLNNGSSSVVAYFDDIRLHPFDANMETYVYDPITLKPVADLDANNYATIYNYDDEGHLIKVKRETKDGIKTVKEGRISTKKYPYIN